MEDIHVGRQPIYTPKLDVVGYELLFRSYNKGSADVVDGDRATSSVLLNTFLEIGLDTLVGDGLAFINLTRAFVLEQHPLPLPPERVVLEVLEDITVDDELIAGVQGLRERGYTVALDDVVELDRLEPLLDMAQIVKLDLMGIPADKLEECVSRLKRHNLKLLAEKVETREEFDRCKELGFDYFQGYFLNKPTVVQGRRIPPSRLSILMLLAKIHDPDVEFSELRDIISQDVALSFKLLRVTNSAYYAKANEIHSIGQALTYLGLRHIQSWVSLLLLSQIDDKPTELTRIALVRAKTCELLAHALKDRRVGAAFSVGLFSTLDALLDVPLEQAVEPLPLSDEIRAALLRHEGRLGELLACVLAYERGDWDAATHPGLGPETIRNTYLETLKWANGVFTTIKA